MKYRYLVMQRRLYFKIVRMLLSSKFNQILGRLAGVPGQCLIQYLSARRFLNAGISHLLMRSNFFVGNIGELVEFKSLCNSWFSYYTPTAEDEKDGRLQIDLSATHPLTPEAVKIFEMINFIHRDFFQKWFSKGFRIYSCHIYRTKHVKNGDAYGATTNWHIDGSAMDVLKVFVLLRDVGPNNGPMEALTTPDRLVPNQARFYLENGSDDPLCEKGTEVFTLCGRAGSVFVIPPNFFYHRATIPDYGHTRDMMVFSLIGSSKKNIKEILNFETSFGILRW